jgi:hypothetical protein
MANDYTEPKESFLHQMFKSEAQKQLDRLKFLEEENRKLTALGMDAANQIHTLKEENRRLREMREKALEFLREKRKDTPGLGAFEAILEKHNF